MRKLFSAIRSAHTRAAAKGARRVGVPRGRDPIAWLIVCGTLLVAAIIVGTVAMVGEYRERALSNSERELENTVLLLSRHFEQQCEDYDAIAANLTAQMQIASIHSSEQFRARMSTPAVHELLRDRANISSHVGDVSIFDSAGQQINSSANWPVAHSPPTSAAPCGRRPCSNIWSRRTSESSCWPRGRSNTTPG